MSAFRIHAPVLNPVSTREAEWYADGALAVDEKGKIAFVGRGCDLPEYLLDLPKIVTSD